MRKFSEQSGGELTEVRCNCCGRKMPVQNGIITECCVKLEVPFGFFSEKDGEVHEFDLCEACYDKILAGFQIPAQVRQMTELL